LGWKREECSKEQLCILLGSSALLILSYHFLPLQLPCESKDILGPQLDELGDEGALFSSL
jgi:hypothetical protein